MILLLCSDNETSLRWRRLLFSYGIPSDVDTYSHAINSPCESMVHAVLLPDPLDKTLPSCFYHLWKLRHPNVPVVMLEQPLVSRTNNIIEEADIRLCGTIPPSVLVQTFLDALSSLYGHNIFDYTKGHVHDRLFMKAPTWNDLPLPLTQTERMIFRYLLLAHPGVVSAEELLNKCTKPGTQPTLSNVPSHIYHINRKATKIIGHHIIGMRDGIGYQLLTKSP